MWNTRFKIILQADTWTVHKSVQMPSEVLNLNMLQNV